MENKKNLLESKLRKIIREELEYYQIDISIGRKFKKGRDSVAEPSRNLDLAGQSFVFRSAGTGGIKYATRPIRDKNDALKIFQSLKIGIEVSTGFHVISVGLFSHADTSYIAVK